MFSTLLQALLLATSGWFAVGSIVIVLILLHSSRGWRNGLAYGIGYLIGYLLSGWAVVAFARPRRAGRRTSQRRSVRPPSSWAS